MFFSACAGHSANRAILEQQPGEGNSFELPESIYTWKYTCSRDTGLSFLLSVILDGKIIREYPLPPAGKKGSFSFGFLSCKELLDRGYRKAEGFAEVFRSEERSPGLRDDYDVVFFRYALDAEAGTIRIFLRDSQEPQQGATDHLVFNDKRAQILGYYLVREQNSGLKNSYLEENRRIVTETACGLIVSAVMRGK